MPRYLIQRLKELPRENFRWAPHTGGLAIVKSKDYEVDGEVEASSPYTVWKTLLGEGRPLRPGDLLEISPANDVPERLYIAKYIGFEPASWYVPESRTDPGTPCEGAPLQSDSV